MSRRGGVEHARQNSSVLEDRTGNSIPCYSADNSLFGFGQYALVLLKTQQIDLVHSHKVAKFPVDFPVSRELGSGERLARDSIHRHLYLDSITYKIRTANIVGLPRKFTRFLIGMELESVLR